jgi:sulfatase modifying factor 1
MEEQYLLKLIDLKNYLKNPQYTADHIKEKLNLLSNWLENNQIDVEPLDQKSILSVAKEIQKLYKKLWKITNRNQLWDAYQSLSDACLEIYDDFSEIEIDWQGRIESQKRFHKLNQYLSSNDFFLEDFQKAYQAYEDGNVFYPDGHNYITFEEALKRHEHRYIKRDRRTVKQQSFDLLRCPAGTFWMGTNEDRFSKASQPRHQVQIPHSFWMAETVVTQELWKIVMGWNPSHFIDPKTPNLPVETVNWYDCLDFCNKLSELEGFEPCFTFSHLYMEDNHIMRANVIWHRNANGYRLPTEEEWEYSAKAGTEWIYAHKEKDPSYQPKYQPLLKTIGVKAGNQCNQWGLHQMSGNVWEWCMDIWDENAYQKPKKEPLEYTLFWNTSPKNRIALRGGSYADHLDYTRVATRDCLAPHLLFNRRGFRILRQDMDDK